MVKIATDDMFDAILADSPSQYFFHKPDTGKIEIVFETGIVKVEPGDEDLADRVWSPKLTDANGNPLLDFSGNPRQPWTKFEAKALIDGSPAIHSFGGERGSLLREFIKAMKKEGVSNSELPGTKWTIEKIGQWDWDIHYLGKGDAKSPSPTNVEKVDDRFENIKKALLTKKDLSSGSLNKDELVTYLSFATQEKPDAIEQIWNKLIEKNVIKINPDNTVDIL